MNVEPIGNWYRWSFAINGDPLHVSRADPTPSRPAMREEGKPEFAIGLLYSEEIDAMKMASETHSATPRVARTTHASCARIFGHEQDTMPRKDEGV